MDSNHYHPDVWDPCSTVELHSNLLEWMDLNHWPRAYQTRTLPLSYTPIFSAEAKRIELLNHFHDLLVFKTSSSSIRTTSKLFCGEQRVRTFIPTFIGILFSKQAQQTDICLLSILVGSVRFELTSAAFVAQNFSVKPRANKFCRLEEIWTLILTLEEWCSSVELQANILIPGSASNWDWMITNHLFCRLNYRGICWGERESRTHRWQFCRPSSIQ